MGYKIVVLLLFFTSCGVLCPIPQPRSEFRGFWVATVVNIDWPKNGDESIEKQKADYIKLLDFYDALNFNAAIVQIRAAGDAFYNSKYAPWSRFLTGIEGEAPKNNEDLLDWMINETHNRGMEFHAWLNPYRATFDLKTEILSPIHDFNRHPEWMIKYGSKYYYNPGLPPVRERLVDIIEEVISNYDVDAIHFDDYFYPYKIKDEIFQDSLSYEFYKLPNQSLQDWRRSNVDSLVKNVHNELKKNKPWVQFGISPFGVWKNNTTDSKGSDTRAGQTTYEDLYANPLLWMQNGWLDYLAPQVYWSMDLPVASHRKIVNWWAKNSLNTNLYIGNGAYKIRNNSDKAWDNKKEIPNQLKLSRKVNEVKGNIFFSAKSLMDNKVDVVNLIKNKYYKYSALPPVSKLTKPSGIQNIVCHGIDRANGMYQFKFHDLRGKRYVQVYSQKKAKQNSDLKMNKLLAKIHLTSENSFVISARELKNKKKISLTFINLYGQESEPIFLNLNQREQHGSKR